MQVLQTQRNPLTDYAEGGRSTTIIAIIYLYFVINEVINIMNKIKKIDNFEGYYISDAGVVFSDLGRGNRHNGKRTEMYKIKPRLTKNGYARVYMRNSITGKRKDEYIHRLVATYFIPNPDKKKYVNHKNCKRDDNRVENLEWCTAKENTDYTMTKKHVKRNKKGQYVRDKRYKKYK